MLLAGLLYHACAFPDNDLSAVRFSEPNLKHDLKLFMEVKKTITKCQVVNISAGRYQNFDDDTVLI